MSRQQDLDRWETDETLGWAQMRGVASFDYNNNLILVRASVTEVAEKLALIRSATSVKTDVAESKVKLTEQCFLVFRFKGHTWSQILSKPGKLDSSGDFSHWENNRLKTEDAQGLSLGLNTDVILYDVSDTACALEYSFYRQGELLEQLQTGEGYEINSFTSQMSDVRASQIEDVEDFVHEFFKEHDALEPGFHFRAVAGYFMVKASDFISLKDWSKDFEQVDFVAV